MKYRVMDSPVGKLTVAADKQGLRFILFGSGRRPAVPGPDWQESDGGIVSEAIAQLRSYFDGQLTAFDLPLAPQGTPFQMAVWDELRKIPYGIVISYGELAGRIGRPKASRAVGAANGNNPISIVIPCHRVIGNDGKLTGYGGGLAVKEALLKLELGTEKRENSRQLPFSISGRAIR